MQKPENNALPTPRTYYAAVMGDVVGSKDINPPLHLYRKLNDVVNAANLKTESIASPLTITLGDEFQGIFYNLTSGLRTIQTMRLKLLDANIQCRFALGIVQLASPLNTKNAWNMMGSGLSNTRDKVEDKKSPNAYRFYLREDKVLEDLAEAVGYSISVIEADWTTRQREVISAALIEGQNIQASALQSNVSVRTLYKVRTAAHFDFYQSQWETLQSLTRNLDSRYNLK